METLFGYNCKVRWIKIRYFATVKTRKLWYRKTTERQCFITKQTILIILKCRLPMPELSGYHAAYENYFIK